MIPWPAGESAAWFFLVIATAIIVGPLVAERLGLPS
jgi:hypothetical protein